MDRFIRRTGVYRLFDQNDQLLYVGAAERPTARWSDHARDKEWWTQVTRKEVVWFDYREDALEAESIAIRNEGPRYNRRDYEYVAPPYSADARRRDERHGLVAYSSQVFRRNMGDRLDEAWKGIHSVILRNDRPVAVLVPDDWYLAALAALGQPLPDAED